MARCSSERAYIGKSELMSRIVLSPARSTCPGGRWDTSRPDPAAYVEMRTARPAHEAPTGRSELRMGLRSGLDDLDGHRVLAGLAEAVTEVLDGEVVLARLHLVDLELAGAVLGED